MEAGRRIRGYCCCRKAILALKTPAGGLMQSTIRGKLLLTIIATSVVSALTLGLVSQMGFKRGFAGYLNEQCRTQLESLRAPLAHAYAISGDWSYVQQHPEAWHRLISYTDETTEKTTPTMYPTPVEEEDSASDRAANLALLDAAKHVIVGSTISAGALLVPINSSGRTVGYIGLEPRRRADTNTDTQFEQSQINLVWEVCAVTALLAIAAAITILRSPLNTLQRVTDAMHRLARGQYDARVSVKSNDEAGHLAQDLNLLANALDTNDRMRRSFFAAVSHELRTPVSILQGELEAIEDGVDTLSIHSLRSFQAEVGALGKLVNDLYDLSVTQIGAPAYDRQPMDLRQTLRASIDAFHERLTRCQLSVQWSNSTQPLHVYGDERRLQQLFHNLLENSARYTDSGGTIRVTCLEMAEHCLIDIEDSSPGVPEEALAHLFDYLYRVEASRNRASGGAGLGLAICRNIVDAHGGQIGCEHSSLGGLRVRIRLPLLRAS